MNINFNAKKYLLIYQLLSLAVLLIDILYVPTITCETDRGKTYCDDSGWQLFFNLGKDQIDNFNLTIVSLNVEVYIIQLLACLVIIFGTHTIFFKK